MAGGIWRGHEPEEIRTTSFTVRIQTIQLIPAVEAMFCHARSREERFQAILLTCMRGSEEKAILR